MNTNNLVVDCPTCGQAVEWDDRNTHRPFCSERCKLIDLGAWANEEYRIAAEPTDPNDPELDDTPH
ncbi:DNA gyrase inhibitor YacG [Mangrovitalea sediminis]|uniref:DNA gyrase inhibitor YacG n=1 Tax=Mangrovitalea sediminis TaxID=1982043 RepID=UPI000BE4BF05|nr:DNA gyrase inhibitor YacG [Mangrovitalea sediminis]